MRKIRHLVGLLTNAAASGHQQRLTGHPGDMPPLSNLPHCCLAAAADTTVSPCFTSGADALCATIAALDIQRSAGQFRRSGSVSARRRPCSGAMSLRCGAAGGRSAPTDSRHTQIGHENDRKLPDRAAAIMRTPQEPRRWPAADSDAQGTHSGALLPGRSSGRQSHDDWDGASNGPRRIREHKEYGVEYRALHSAVVRAKIECRAAPHVRIPVSRSATSAAHPRHNRRTLARSSYTRRHPRPIGQSALAARWVPTRVDLVPGMTS